MPDAEFGSVPAQPRTTTVLRHIIFPGVLHDTDAMRREGNQEDVRTARAIYPRFGEIPRPFGSSNLSLDTMTPRRPVSTKQIDVYTQFNGDVDMYQRRRVVLPDMFDEAWSTIADLRQRLGSMVAGICSERYRQSVNADLLAWTEDDKTRERLYEMVRKDLRTNQNHLDV